MSDEEVEIRYHEMQLAKLRKSIVIQTPPTLRMTDTYFYFEQCPTCGHGRVAKKVLDGWYIDYHYQDGHETVGPYERETAVKLYLSVDRERQNVTLIGPDNRVYTI